jgi:hypothetical protein
MQSQTGNRCSIYLSIYLSIIIIIIIITIIIIIIIIIILRSTALFGAFVAFSIY